MFHTVSLFTGAGGLDIGLEQEGFSARVFVEIDRDAQATLAANPDAWNMRKVPVLGDITFLPASDVLKAAKLAPGEATLLAGGPPCQSFSTAGKRGSISDPRGNMFQHFARMVEEVQPRFFVFENVRGILSAAIEHRPLHLRGGSAPPLRSEEELGSVLRDAILPRLKGLGYEVVYGLVNAADYGVPQTRQRVIFLGSRDREFGSDRWPFFEAEIQRLMPTTHTRVGETGTFRWRTLGDALECLVDPRPEFIPYSESRRAVMDLVPPGKNWRHLRETQSNDFLRGVMGGAYAADGGKVGFWRRLDFEKPAPTVPASPIQKGTSLCHPLETRPLSVREYARVQQFPDDYRFEGSISSKYRQIGNAVPIGLARAVGRALKGVMDGELKVAEADATYATATL